MGRMGPMGRMPARACRRGIPTLSSPMRRLISRFCTLRSAFYVVLIALACRTAPPPGVAALDWPATEKCVYSLAVDSAPVGVYSVAIRSLDTLGHAALEIASLTVLQTPAGLASDSAVVLARRAGLAPLRSRRTVSAPSGTARASVTWAGGRAAMLVEKPEETLSVSLRVDRRTFDNDQLTTLLRVLDVPPETTVALQALSGMATIAIPVRVQSLPDERAVVPAGDFLCRRLRMTVLGRDIDLWYEPAGTRRMVRYLDSSARLVMELLPGPRGDTAVSPGS